MTFPGLAAGVGSGVKNVQFVPSADILARKILIVGTYDPLITTISDETLYGPYTNHEQVGDVFGFGFMAHRLARAAYTGTRGSVQFYVMPQAEAGGATAAAGEIDWLGTTGVEAGTLALYLAGERYAVTITDAMTLENVSDAVVAAVNAVDSAPVVAAKTAVTFETTFTAKSKGPEGDKIDISLNLEAGDATPTGIVAAITAMTGGAGVPTIADALAALGTGDNANEAGFTAMVHGYGQDTTTLDAVLAYVGAGNDYVGLYSKTVARPFRSLVGDVAHGSAGLAALVAIADARRTDRANGVVSVPGSQSHPSEIAAQAIGIMERKNSIRAEEAYVEDVLVGVRPGPTADRWTSDYDSRDIAVNGGISPTKVDGGVVKLQNVVSFYRPASVPVSSNGYREMVNISKLQNLLNSQKVNFSQEKWQNVTIVADVSKVTNPTSRQKARDVNSVLDDLIQLVNAWAGRAWIADASFTIGKLKSDSSLVTIRTGGDGFNITIPVILSGIGNVYNVTTEFDISFAALA